MQSTSMSSLQTTRSCKMFSRQRKSKRCVLMSLSNYAVSPITDRTCLLQAHPCRKIDEMQNAVRSFDHVSFLANVPLTFRYRDNLEFLQWIKRFWDQNYGGHPYDPVARRKGAPTDTPATVAPLQSNRLGSGAATGRAGGRTPIGGMYCLRSELCCSLDRGIKVREPHLRCRMRHW